MRVIKFRAWNTLEKSWLKIDIDDWSDCDASAELPQDRHTLDLTDNNTCIWQQLTGLKDWEGKELYEGDVLGTNKGGELEAHGEIIFDTDLAQFTIKYKNGGWAELWQHLHEKTNQGRELIGNIYENPELITAPTNDTESMGGE